MKRNKHFFAFLYPIVTAFGINLELNTPVCLNKMLFFTCEIFATHFIQWKYKAFFGYITFMADDSARGDRITTSDDKVIAILIKKMPYSGGLYHLASTLIIYAPLNDVNSFNLNDTVMECVGDGSSRNGTLGNYTSGHFTSRNDTAGVGTSKEGSEQLYIVVADESEELSHVRMYDYIKHSVYVSLQENRFLLKTCIVLQLPV